MSRRFEESSPQLGEPLPDITAYDQEGQELELRDLKDSYAVLVFGCLT
jgi:peroxiredoxin